MDADAGKPELAELMSCFVRKDVANDKFPVLSRKVKKLKTTEGGVTVMCGVMEKYLAEARTEGKEEAIHDIVLKLLEAGKTAEEIVELTGIEPNLVKEVEAGHKAL